MCRKILPALCILLQVSCQRNTDSLQRSLLLSNYPSGSALSSLDHKIYVMGDDAPDLLELDEGLHAKRKLRVSANITGRLPKETKQDLEAMAVLRTKKNYSLLLVGSGSLSPYRNYCQLITPAKSEMFTYDLSVFYQRLKNAGIKDLNVEGASAVPGGIVLASRGNKSFRWNHLIFTDNEFYKNPDSSGIRIVRVGINSDTSVFNGISGIDYAQRSDMLLVTASTENTFNSYADGAIGKSYLWIFNDITSRKRFTHLNPDRVIDLEELDSAFKGHKIESVCVLDETRLYLSLLLAADDDQGQTVLFKIRLHK